MKPKYKQLRAAALKRESKMKTVVINAKTTIFVKRNISDEQARQNYLIKLENRKHN